MSADAGLNPLGLDLVSIPERIQTEVQRAIQRSIKLPATSVISFHTVVPSGVDLTFATHLIARS